MIDPTPFLGDVTISNGYGSIDWTLEPAEGQFVKLKNENGYVEEVHWNGNQYTPHGTRAKRFQIENSSDGAYRIREVTGEDRYYTHKGGNFVLHGYMSGNSNWNIEKK